MLSRLFLRNFRNISEMAIDSLATVNTVVGPNGAGKTALFEAIFTLAHGRSFRRFGGGREALVSLKADELIVYGETCAVVGKQRSHCDGGADSAGLEGQAAGADAFVTHKIGLSKSRSGETRIKFNGVPVRRMSEVTEGLPIIAINADTFDLLSGPPQERRGFLDWSVFHVEHNYKDEVKMFARALAQRNALLRIRARKVVGRGSMPADPTEPLGSAVDTSVGTELGIWTDAMARAGEQLDARRRDIFDSLNTEFKGILADLSLEGYSLALSYKRGWDKKLGLSEALLDAEEMDSARGFSSVGPHRCDVQITIVIDGRRRLARDVLSRGQLKLTIFALKLSQLRVLRRVHAGVSESSKDVSCVLLLDDIAAELDPDKLRSVGAIISAAGGVQVFVNGTTAASLSPFIEPFEASSFPIKKFHVEHGCLL